MECALTSGAFVRVDSGDLTYEIALGMPEVMGLLHAQPQRGT